MQDHKKRQLDRDLTENEIKQIASHVVAIYGDIIEGENGENGEKTFIINPEFVLELEQLISYGEIDKNEKELQGDIQNILNPNTSVQSLVRLLGQDSSRFILSQDNVRQIYGYIIKNSRLPENAEEIESLYEYVGDLDFNAVFDKIHSEDIDEKLQYVKKEYSRYCATFQNKSEKLAKEDIEKDFNNDIDERPNKIQGDIDQLLSSNPDRNVIIQFLNNNPETVNSLMKLDSSIIKSLSDKLGIVYSNETRQFESSSIGPESNEIEDEDQIERPSPQPNSINQFTKAFDFDNDKDNKNIIISM